MKTAVSLFLALSALAPVHAQVLGPSAVNGAVLGGIAGAVIGHNSGDLRHNGWKGAAIGAGAGLVIGSIADGSRERREAHRVPVPAAPHLYVYRHDGHHAGRWHENYRHGGYGRSHYGSGYYGAGYYGPSYGYGYSAPLYTSTYVSDYDVGTDSRADYRASGLILGGIAGAIIGHNSGDLRHNGWKGAAIGATAGYLLGSIAESNARRRAAALAESAEAYSPAPTVATEPSPAPVAVTPAAPPAPARPMSAANSLFGRD